MTRLTTTEVTIDRRKITKGDVLKFSHVRGDFEFVKAYILADGSVDFLLVCGGTAGRKLMRQFSPDKIAKKYRTSTLEAKGLR